MYEYEKYFKQITDSSQNNSLTFFVGAGVSAISGAPTWSKLIDNICEEINYTPKKPYTTDDFLKIPQMYYYAINRNKTKYYSYITEILKEDTLEPNVIHDKLLEFNPCSFVTTNFDNLLEKAVQKHAQWYKTIACDTEIASINGDRYILKLHGDLKHKNIVFKEEDYLNYSEKFKLIETVLKSIFSMNTVVFIGYSLNDYNIKLILNWTKSLLKDKFNEPIFINTDSIPLTQSELQYHESRGLKVIESININPEMKDNSLYQERYLCVLNAIKMSVDSFMNKSAIEVFDSLFNTLLPLGSLNAIRTTEILDKLEKYIRICNYQSGRTIHYNGKLFNHYIEIKKLTDKERRNLPQEELKKYELISSVLLKAQIKAIESNDNFYYLSTNNTDFADALCINFDYIGMYNITHTKTNSILKLYRKAYYFAKLHQYEEAHKIFKKIATRAFSEKKYLIYYFAQINCNNLDILLKNPNHPNGNVFYMGLIVESKSIFNTNTKSIFENLPIEVRNKYNSLKDLCSPLFLYKLSYDSIVDSQHLQAIVDLKTVEIGISSSNIVKCRIKDYINFLFANGLCFDFFNEFKSSIINLMNQLVYNYSIQIKESISKNYFDSIPIIFDDIDFYCFIEYFDPKSIITMFTKYNIGTIRFTNYNKIIESIKNIIRYYQKIVYPLADKHQRDIYEMKIVNCISCLCFMDISMEVVEEICQFICSCDYDTVYSDEILYFLDIKLNNKNQCSDKIEQMLEEYLLNFLDDTIRITTNNEEDINIYLIFRLNFYKLAQYIKRPSKDFSEHLLIRITKIIELANDLLLNDINYLFDLLNISEQNILISKIESLISKDFNFNFLVVLLEHNIPVSSNIINSLYSYIREQINNKNMQEKILLPIKEDTELKQVAIWCFLGKINREMFNDFCGKNDFFDFLFQYDQFNYLKFKLEWLPEIKKILPEIIKNKKVKKEILSHLYNALSNENVDYTDKNWLINLLIKYFS